MNDKNGLRGSYLQFVNTYLHNVYATMIFKEKVVIDLKGEGTGRRKVR